MVANYKAELEAIQSAGTNPEDLVLVPESIENEARLIRSLCDHYRASLNETLNATPEVDVQSVQDAINLFKLNYEELTVVLDRLLDTQTKLPPSKYSDNIKKANELFEAIKEAKSKIVTGLIMEAELKYDARIREESVTVPTGESVNDEPNIINFVKPNNGNEKGLTVEEINSKVADDFNTIEHQMANLEYSEDFLKVSVPARVKFEKIKGLLEEGNKLKNSTAKASSLTGPAMLSELKRRVDYFADFVDKLMLEFNELNKLMKSTENSSSIPFKKSPLTEAIEQIYVPTETNENDTDKLRNQIEEYANPPMATEPIATPETLDNEDVALDQETPKSEEKSIEKDIKWGLRFYGHWQNGNLDGVFRHKNQKWVEKETIVKIRQDIKITLEAAGYSEPEINNFFETKVNPWAEEVVDQRRTRKYQDIDHGALKGQIINAVREMIKDREPNPDVFRAHYESQGVGNTNQPAEVVGDLADSVVVDSLAENAEYTPISDGFAEDELVSPIGSEITDSEVLSGATVNFENLIKADELPVADSAAVAGAEAPQAGSTSEQPTPEAPSAVEAEITPELAEAKEAFMAEKSRHEELLEIVDINSGEQKDLPYLIDADLWRAGMVFKSVDSILTNPRYNDEERADKLRGPVTVLKEINKKIADILQQKSLLASPEAVATPEPVEETGSKDMPALEWSPTTPAVQAPEAPVPAMSPEAQASRERLIAAGINPDAQVRAESVKERHLEHREKIKEAKARMSELKAKHTNGLKDYYRNRGFLRKIGDGSRKLVGKGDFLPKELQELQSKSDQAADEYKTLISAKLEMRSGRATGSKYTPDNSSIISGLDERLVLDPYAEQTKVVQEAKAEQAADWPRINRIMTKMRDNPRATRAVSLAFASTMGWALTGGAGGALWAGTRWAMSVTGGTLAAMQMYKLRQGKVSAAESYLSDTLGTTPLAGYENNSVAKRRQALRIATTQVEVQKLRQKATALGTAVLVGGAINATANIADAHFNISNQLNGLSGGSETTIPQRTGDGSIRPNSTFAEGSGVDSLNPDGLIYNPTEQTAETSTVANGPETLSTLVQVGKVEMPDTTLGAMTVTNIELQGSGFVGTLEVGAIPESEVKGLYKAIDLATKDILEANPHTPKAEVERLLFEKVQKQYGDTTWWKQANISQIKIEDISLEYTVKSGDTIWEIAQKNSEALKDVSAEDRSRVLMELRARIDASAELRDEIGVSSDKADLIRTGEKLDLVEMEEEIRDIIADKEVLATRPGTGTLPINTNGVEMGVQDIKIKVEPVPFKPEEFGVVNVEAATAMASVPEFDASVAGPRPFSLDGNYFNTEVYKDYVLGHFGGEEQLAKFLDRAITKVEGQQTAWDEIVGKPRVYDVIKDMSVKDLTEIQNTPEGIKAFASLNDIDENKLQEWLYNFGEMKKVSLPYSDTTKFSDLFSRATVEPYITNINRGK